MSPSKKNSNRHLKLVEEEEVKQFDQNDGERQQQNIEADQDPIQIYTNKNIDMTSEKYRDRRLSQSVGKKKNSNAYIKSQRKNRSKNQSPNQSFIQDRQSKTPDRSESPMYGESDKSSNPNLRGLMESQTLQKMKNKYFLSLGYGVNAYFDTLASFIKLYGIMSIINLVIIYIYNQYDGMKSLSGAPLSAKLSIGNLGFSEPLCSSVNFGVNHNLLACPYGSIQKVHSFGIHASQKQNLPPVNDAISITSFIEFLNIFKPKDKGLRCVNKNNDVCNKFIDLKKAQKSIEEECIGKDACYLENFYQFLKNTGYSNDEELYQSCIDDDAVFYVQVQCLQSEEQLEEKSRSGLLVSFLVIIQAIIFTYFIQQFKKRASEKYEEWDLATTTTSDYTVEFKIHKEMFDAFCQKDKELRAKLTLTEENDILERQNFKGSLFRDTLKRNKSNILNSSRIFRFKEHLINEIEQILAMRPACVDPEIKRIKIVDVVFAFKSSVIIRKLMDRGTYIMSSEQDKIIKVEQELDNILTEKQEEFSEPVRAYIIFQDEEGYQRACHMSKQTVCCQDRADHYWYGKPVYFKAAPEPSNIMWENQYWPFWLKTFRKISTFLIVVLILLVQVSFMFLITKKNVQFQSKYPIVDCHDIKQVYGDNLQKFAILQWHDFSNDLNTDQRSAHLCFCENLVNHDGIQAALLNEYTTTNKKGDMIGGQICSEFLQGKYILKVTKFGISLMILMFNYLLRTTIIDLVKWIGKKTFSSQMNSILKFLFISQFINTGLILLSVHSNFENAHLPYVKKIFNGSYPDFTMEWYYKIGSIYTQTLFILGLSPLIDTIKISIYNRIKQYKDSKTITKIKPLQEIQSQSKTKSQFIECYSGPEMLIHYRYSGIIVNVFVSMLYGVGVPMIIPVVLMNFIIQYCLDRLLTVYLYKQPPLFDQQLTQTALNILQWGVILYLGFGYWMLSNKQIFTNTIHPKEYAKEIIYTGHDIANIEIDHAFPVLVFLIAVAAVLFFVMIKNFIEEYFIKSSQEQELLGFEGLVRFYKSLYKSDLDFWIQEEMKLKDFSLSQMRIANISYLAYKSKHEQMVEEKGLQTVGCYELLAQPKYKELLQYVPISHRIKLSEGQTIKQYGFSDKLRKYIDFPYLNDD
ncbi:UNKNOWN [Stylonychia lemnae]|uniref:tRNA (GuanineN(7))methyltransferase n=1 Tax=Stylonychia lemnae TaxID=5949 RepID=A0A078BDT4_STYLE|nr:UNKNOWN [Stylonychia lemnae]|eukprot:CDW91332.1 UNKNOWN [Stylonychia lemnae]